MVPAMFAHVQSPETLRPEELDAYLEKGWFRMGQTIFTTNFLRFKEQFYSAIWLRVLLPQWQGDKTYQKLLKKNAAFKAIIKEASIDAVKESLFVKYKQTISFEASASLQALMMGTAFHSVYHTFEVTLYDEDKLIAVGFFDRGMVSAAGIISFYDPDYRHFSLGKYLIFLKMDYCRKHNLQYFYPGYFVPGYSVFDYKLGIGKHALQYRQLASSQWLPISSYSISEIPLSRMFNKLQELQAELAQMGIYTAVVRYEFFDVNLVPAMKGAGLFDYPLFLYKLPFRQFAAIPVIVYDIRDQYYHCMACRCVWTTDLTDTENLYTSNLLKVDQYLFSASTGYDMIQLLKRL